MSGRILDSTATPLDALTIVRDFYLLCERVDLGTLDPESIAWSTYRNRCRGCLTIANVWGFESDKPLEDHDSASVYAFNRSVPGGNAAGFTDDACDDGQPTDQYDEVTR